MFVVLGATGHIGAQVVESLKPTGQEIVAITHDAGKARSVSEGLFQGMAVDVADADALRDVFRKGERALLLNPPAPPSSDTNAEELRTARSIANAVEGSGLEKVLVVSTYGAQEGDAIGDLSVLWEFERLIEATGVAMAVNRGAYYYTNIDSLIEPARNGELPTPFPADLVMPMVSPVDLGKAAAVRLRTPIEDVGIRYVEGPRRYSFADVAAVLSDQLGRPVHINHISRDAIEASYLELGFSQAAARAFTNMTIASLDGPEFLENPIRGDITLEQHLRSTMEKANGR